jgi:gamma-glutamyltranspeptidase/glutathione hydrolase
MSAIDSSGLAISLTSTINLIFGSELMVPETGVIMNNEMDDFSIPGSSNQFGYIPSPSNYAKPGKRMLSSMCPTIVYHPSSGETYLVTGAAGGSRIITSTVLSVINVIDRGMNAPDAVAEPRQHDQLVPQQTAFEWAFDNSTTAFMKERGHNVTWVGPGQSAVQAIRVLDSKNSDKPVYEVAPEPRQKNSGGTVV